jgi:arylsulfatase A-like enzyme
MVCFNTVFQSQFSLSTDIAPTIVDAAGLPDTFNFDGVSLKNLSQPNNYPAGYAV